MLKRAKKVTFRMTEAEHKHLKTQVERSRLNTEAYIRAVIKGENITTTPAGSFK